MGQSEQPSCGEDLPAGLSAGFDELRRRSAHCPDPEVLQAVQSGVLAADLRERVTKHVDICPICKCLMQSFEALGEPPLQAHESQAIWSRVQAGVAGSSPLRASQRLHSWRTLFLPRWAIAAAVAALAISAVGIGWLRESRPAPATVSQARPSRQDSSVTALRLEKAPVMLPASAVLVWRGADGGAIRNDFQDAFMPYSSGDYALAAERFERLASKYPRSGEAHFYLGVCRLFLNANDSAAQALGAASDLARQPLSDEVNWYLALADHRLARDNAARPLLESVCRSAERNSVNACTALRELSVVK